MKLTHLPCPRPMKSRCGLHGITAFSAQPTCPDCRAIFNRLAGEPTPKAAPSHLTTLIGCGARPVDDPRTFSFAGDDEPPYDGPISAVERIVLLECACKLFKREELLRRTGITEKELDGLLEHDLMEVQQSGAFYVTPHAIKRLGVRTFGDIAEALRKAKAA